MAWIYLGRKKGAPRPPLNTTAGKVWRIWFVNDKNDLDKADEFAKMLTFATVLKYKIYKLKHWLWEMRKKKFGQS